MFQRLNNGKLPAIAKDWVSHFSRGVPHPNVASFATLGWGS